MAENSLFPGFIKLFYTSNAHPHTMTIPVKPFLNVGSTWSLEMKNSAGGILWADGLTAYITVLKTLLHTSAVFTTADLYTMASPTADPLFRETIGLTIAGTNVTTAFPFSQGTITFRSAVGGTYRMQLMEIAGTVVNQEINPPFTGNLLAISAYLTGNFSVVFARDGGGLVAPTRYLSKTNDALRKKYLLDG